MRLHEAEQVALALGRERDRELAGDPARRRAHGVVHTPPELARLVVHGVDTLLRECIGVPLGLTDPRVHVVDPACGPGAFLGATLALCAERGSFPARITGFDLDARALRAAQALAPYAGADASRLQLLEADTLRDPELLAQLASTPHVLAILGNPPWTTSAARPSRDMQAMLEDFRRDEHGRRLPERKLGVLSDAYVRFVRWAARAAQDCRQGAVIGLVTNGSFLDGPVHRGMRAALTRFFSELRVLDLGGNALLASSPRSGERDDNVFGVRPSVAITWCARAVPAPRSVTRLYHARVTGSKEEKLALCARARLSDLPWTLLRPELGRPFGRAQRTHGRYAQWPSLPECMPFHREGVQSNRDAAVIDRDRERLLDRLRAFASGSTRPELSALVTPRPHFDPAVARRALVRALEQESPRAAHGLVRPLSYRPFDDRWFCALPPLCHRPRPELLRACDHGDFALLTVRKDRGSAAYAHFALVRQVADSSFLSARSSCRTRVFPVHTAEGEENLAPALKAAWQDRLGCAVDAAGFSAWAACVLASASYRERHAEALRADYPRIPPPPSAEAFTRARVLALALREAFRAPVSPALVPEPGGSSSTRLGELVLTRAAPADPGRLHHGARTFAEPSARALDLHVGHHQLVRRYLHERRAYPLTPPVVADLLAFLLCVEELSALVVRADELIAPSLS